MIQLEVQGDPVPWSSHRGHGKKSFNPKFKEREYARWQLRSQWNQKTPLQGPIKLHCTFFFVPPKSTSKIRTKQMLNGIMHHIVKPDTSNCLKFIEDCLKTIVFEDDNQVVELTGRKLYAQNARTLIILNPV